MLLESLTIPLTKIPPPNLTCALGKGTLSSLGFVFVFYFVLFCLFVCLFVFLIQCCMFRR